MRVCATDGWTCMQNKLAALLSDFARTLLTDFPIQAILDRLVERITEALPVDAVGVTLISPGTAPHYIAASNGAALTYERLQTEYSEGPCRLAYESGEAVIVPDLSVENRFPRFAGAALSAGLGAAFAFPLRHNDGRLGALDLYRDSPGPLAASDLEIAQTLADVTAAYVLNAQARELAHETSDRFRESALHDPLTGLANRLLLQQRLEHAAQRAKRSKTDAAVLFADLDRFKAINDTYGHQVGDELLIAVAQRLAQLVRPGDTLARVSGDEFVFLCEDLRTADDIETLAARIDEALSLPFSVSGQQITMSASVGMAYAGPGEEIDQQLVADADIAMYQAKRKGGAAHQVIDLREAHQTADRHTLEQELHTAFAGQHLDVAYQPIVRIGDRMLTGAEALLRWTHPERGPIRTLDMIGIAEDNGLIIPLGAWVLERACTDHGRWLRRNPRTALDLAVNVSSRQLLAPGYAPSVAAVLESTGTDPAAVVLEMTEGIFIGDVPRTLTVLRDLRSLGVRLALDDFGTGYSSLSYLRDLPVDILKIDQSFVRVLGSTDATRSMVAAMTQLAHVMGLVVVAEGVETSEQLNAIVEVGCDYAQGFLFASAMPAAEFADLLSANEPIGPIQIGARRPPFRGRPTAVA
jgi:diguanylate cyclase (GGDEF)-like protein